MTVPSHILTIDDDPFFQADLFNLLKENGLRASAAPSAEAGLRLAALDRPDLILLDLRMPNEDGLKVLHRIKGDARLAGVPVVFLSSLDDPSAIADAFRLGASDFVVKPAHPDVLLARIRTHLAIREGQRRMEGRLQELQRVEDLRKNLVQMVVHDIRSPLTAIQGSLSLASQCLAPQEGRIGTHLDRAGKSLDWIMRMLVQMLDLSRLEAGAMPLQRERQDLLRLVQASIEALEDHPLFRTITVTADGPLVASVDGDLLGRVLTNLLENALKYSRRTDRIEVRVGRHGPDAEIRVINEGPPLVLDHPEDLFDKFTQGAEGRYRGGAGLGLAFCRLAVEAHGGRIGVEGLEDSGTQFWLSLPLAPVLARRISRRSRCLPRKRKAPRSPIETLATSILGAPPAEHPDPGTASST